MAALPDRIPLRRLWSTKTHISFRDDRCRTPGDRFFELVHRFRTGRRVDPIEVVQHGGNYVILNGVRRALAAKAAGQQGIEATIVHDAVAGRPIGHTVPLSMVLFPHDLRG